LGRLRGWPDFSRSLKGMSQDGLSLDPSIIPESQQIRTDPIYRTPAEQSPVDVMGAGGSLSQSGAGMNISGNSSSGSEASILGFDPVTNVTQRNQIDAAYQPGTGNGANNGS
jgi:hypothetical protein